MRHFTYLLLLLPALLFSQEKAVGQFTVDAGFFYGNIVPHRKSIQHLITAHPEGMLLSFNRKTFGAKEWERSYNFPDYGFSFHYQDMKNETLGKMYGLYGHYSFYFLQRNLMFRVAQGIAYTTNPYDSEDNFRNYAYGVHFMPTTYFMLNFHRENVLGNFGMQTGLVFIHHSNASMKQPNTSTNTFAVNVGLNYNFDTKESNTYITRKDTIDYSEPVHYNIAFKAGLNETEVIGLGQKPYYALSLYADKRVSRKSAFQLGADVFWPLSQKEYIEYKAVAYPEENNNPNTDYRKAGAFAGYELFINKLSVELQAGAYVYNPSKITGTLYQRVGLKYYVAKKVFSSLTLKTHGAKAEVLEFGVGLRL